MKRVVAALLVMVARILAGKSVRGLEHVREARQRIYFANHTSHLDFLLIWSSLPRALRKYTRPVAARDYWDSGAFRRYLVCGVFNAVLVGRSEDGPRGGEVARLVSELGENDSLVFFPEGTRGSGEVVAEFRSGLYHLCRERPGLELVPVRIEKANRILPKGAVVPVPRTAHVTFGKPIRLGEQETKADFLERARASLEALR